MLLFFLPAAVQPIKKQFILKCKNAVNSWRIKYFLTLELILRNSPKVTKDRTLGLKLGMW